MKRSIQVFAFIILYFSISSTAFAQETATDSSATVYDLNDFKFRFQRYRALEFDYRMDGAINNMRTGNSFLDDFTSRFNSFNLNANLRGNSFENSERLQRLQSFQVLVTTINQQQELKNFPNDFESKSSSAQVPYLGYENTSRKYNDNRFSLLEYGGNFSVNTFRRPEADSNVSPNIKGNETNFNVGVGAGLGFGRIENVSDAVTSYFILRDLQRTGVLQNFTATQLENLADGIVKTRNDRYIGDNRFRYVDQITRLDSVCKANGIVAANPVALFTVLYDNFIFTNYFRETGKRHSFSLELNNNYTRSTENNSEPGQIAIATIGPKYEYVNAFQKSMFLQRKTTVTASTGGVFYYLIENELGPNLQSNLSINHGYVYQPNTRTIFDVSAFVQARTNSNKLDEDRLRETFTNVGIQLNSNYFISRRFSLFLNANSFQSFTNLKFSNSDGEALKIRNFQFNFNSGLTYAFY